MNKEVNKPVPAENPGLAVALLAAMLAHAEKTGHCLDAQEVVNAAASIQALALLKVDEERRAAIVAALPDALTAMMADAETLVAELVPCPQSD